MKQTSLEDLYYGNTNSNKVSFVLFEDMVINADMRFDYSTYVIKTTVLQSGITITNMTEPISAVL